MSYVVLARKWRPQQFSDVLGQEHVTRTLTNAIQASRIAHAFIFSGPRGVGKTSAARILSKALCCIAQDGPTAEPCGVCGQCVEITEGRSTDVFEIDAASHTGVDNVREIIDNVRYLPSKARFKIYVIDEVHMLSKGAFNALLKTLEEPPAHVKFVLATTDVHAVPVTILSRCQRYDFRRIPLSRITARLSDILGRESIEHDPSALSRVAREAEGSMRDAQSLLEQVLAFAGGRPLDGALVRDALGVVDDALVERAFAAMLERTPGTLIEVVGDVHDRGLDLKRFTDALIEHARDLLSAKLVKDPATVLDRPSDEVRRLVDQAKSIDVPTLERLFEQLCKITEDLGRASHPRFVLEVGLASIAGEPPRVSVEDLLAQLERVEALMGGDRPRPGPQGSGGSGGPSGSRGGGRFEPPPRRGGPPGPGMRSAPEPAPSTGKEPWSRFQAPADADGGLNAPRTASPAPPENRAEGGRGSEGAARNFNSPGSDAHGAGVDRFDAMGAAPHGPSAQNDPRASRASSSAPSEPRSGPSSGPHGSSTQSDPRASGEHASRPGGSGGYSHGPQTRHDAGADSAARGARSEGQRPSAGPGSQGAADFRGFVDLVRKRRAPLAATLIQVRPLEFSAEGVQLGCETAFDEAKLNDQETKRTVEGLLAEFFGRPVVLVVTRARPNSNAEVPASAPPTINEVNDAAAADVRRQKEATARERPSVKAIAAELGGSIAKVRVLDEG